MKGEKCSNCCDALNITLPPYFGRCLHIILVLSRIQWVCNVSKPTCFASWIADGSWPHFPTPSAFVPALLEGVMFTVSICQGAPEKQNQQDAYVKRQRFIFRDWLMWWGGLKSPKSSGQGGRVAGWQAGNSKELVVQSWFWRHPGGRIPSSSGDLGLCS